MSMDRLAVDVMRGIEKSGENMLEVPIKLLANILFPNQRVSAEQIHNKTLEMKMKYDTIDYVVIMTREPIFRFYGIKPEPKETQLINEEVEDGRTTNSGTPE